MVFMMKKNDTLEQDHIIYETVTQKATKKTVQDYIFPRLKAAYGRLFNDGVNELEFWAYELRSMPLHHVRFCFKVLSVIDQYSFEKYPPNPFQFKNMWSNALKRKSLHSEEHALKSALNMCWSLNPCVFPAISKVGVEFFQTINDRFGNDHLFFLLGKDKEFYHYYTECVGDYVIGAKINNIFGFQSSAVNKPICHEEWMESLGFIDASCKELAIKITAEFDDRIKMGENPRDIYLSLTKGRRIKYVT